MSVLMDFGIIVLVYLVLSVVFWEVISLTQKASLKYEMNKYGVLAHPPSMDKKDVWQISFIPVMNFIFAFMEVMDWIENKMNDKGENPGKIASIYLEYVVGRMPDKMKDKYTPMMKLLKYSPEPLKKEMLEKEVLAEYKEQLEEIVLIVKAMEKEQNRYTEQLLTETEPLIETLQSGILAMNEKLENIENLVDYKQYLRQKEVLENISKMTKHHTKNEKIFKI